MSTSAKIKSLDFYRKIPRDLTEASLSGAGLSLIAALAMFLLFGMELATFMSIDKTTTVVVDRSQDGDVLRINFNLSFPALSCEFASVDVSDVLGTHRFNLTKTVRKFPIDPKGEIAGPEFHGGNHQHAPAHADEASGTERHLQEQGSIPAATSPLLNDENFDEVVKAQYPVTMVNFYAPWCPWSQRLEPVWEKAFQEIEVKYPSSYEPRIKLAKVDCTQAVELCRRHHIQGFPSIRIFRQGQDIRSAHGHHDHESYYGDRTVEALVQFASDLVAGSAPQALPGPVDASGVAQPRRILAPAPQSAGCQIEGFVLVKKVPGNLMVSAASAGHSFDASTMNMTHIVNHFSFGRRLSFRKQHEVDRLNPHHLARSGDDRLTDRIFPSHGDNVTHEHYLQVVLTTVEPLEHKVGQHVDSYDYTAHSNTFQSTNVPVAKFHYELSPMQVLITERRRSFSHFLTNVCAIIGGVFTVAGIIDGILHNTLRIIKKVELGKHH